MLLSLSKAELMKGQPINPGWYKAEVIAFVARPPKTSNDSMNYVPTFKLETPTGETLDHTFNSKAIGRMGPFIAAVQNKTLAETLEAMGNGSLQFETDDAVGKKLQIKIINETYEGRLVNKVDGFLPYGAQVPF